MSLMPFTGRCIHCGHDHGNAVFSMYKDIPNTASGNSVSTIEQLTARVRELEEEIERLKKHQCAPVCIFHEGDEREELKKQLAASQAYAEQLLEALIDAKPLVQDWCNENGGAGLAVFVRLRETLALPRDTSTLDSYVAEKVKEAMK